ncbi:MAG TPA: PqqD family protein [Allosphingosinicella sp.]|nr:PqqD family protein [Allosphingosinicella sp.]
MNMENMVVQDLRVERRGEMIETEVDGELVALHIDKGTCYGFNGTATRIWTMIEQPRLLSEMTEELMREFDVDRPTCEAQLKALLDELAADGLVEIRPA